MMRCVCVFLAMCVVSCVSATAVASDERWEISTRMEISGLLLRMPATTVVVCTPPGGMNEERLVERDGCTLDSLVKSGNSTRFRVQCTKPQPMSGEGEIIRHSSDAWSGQFKAQGKFAGRTVDVQATLNSKRNGVCAASADAIAADGDAPAQEMPASVMQIENLNVSDPAVLEALQQLQNASGDTP